MSNTKIKSQKEVLPCGDASFQRLCLGYSDRLPCCEAVIPRKNIYRDPAKILAAKVSCADVFGLKEELLSSGLFKFKVTSWCMYPVLKKGDVLDIIPARIDEMEIGDIPVYRSRGKLYAHRIVDKQLREGKRYVLTRPDSIGDISDNKKSEWILEEDILGRIETVRREEKVFSPEKKSATAREKFFYKKIKAFLNLKVSLKKALGALLVKLQSLWLYQALGERLTTAIKPFFSFKIGIPFSNQLLNRVYNYIPLKESEKIIFSRLKKTSFFYLILRCYNISLGYLAILNRPENCPYQGFWIGEVYIRLRYRGLGLDSILLSKAKKFLKKKKKKE